jgi:hypothetical protein
MDKQSFVPKCPCTVRAMRAAEASRDGWNATLSHRENIELLDALAKHGYVSAAAEARMRKLRELHS